MSREINKDFNHLKTFIENYSVKSLFSEDEFEEIISQYHKKYYAFLTLLAEFQGIVDEGQYEYLLESCSDAGTSLFHIFHGAYKSSKLILRSSIETFLKGFAKDSYPDIIEETSMFEIFKNIKNIDYFNHDFIYPIIEKIHQIYKDLCKDVHTAEKINMENISALNHFPKFSVAESKKITDFSSKLIKSYISLLCYKYNSNFHSIHYKNKDIIKQGIPKKNRPIIFNVK
jgi:hypothetical protein